MHYMVYLRTLAVTQILEGMWKEPARIAISDTISGIGVEAVTEPTRHGSLLLWTCVQLRAHTARVRVLPKALVLFWPRGVKRPELPRRACR